MTHLEEGTIHAWLDGALNDAEAREVSEHTASCAECAAKVAEARGFIAGASRILTSLDDVSAGVSPRRAPVVASAKPAQRFWQASPWVTSIAAVLILAIGMKEWLDRPSAQNAIARVEPPGMDSLRAALPAQATPVDSSLRMKVVSAPAPKLVSAPPVSELGRRAADASSNSSGAGAAGLASTSADAGPQPAAGRKEVLVPESVPVVRGDVARKSAMKDARARGDERMLAGCYPLGVGSVRRFGSEALAKAASAVPRDPAIPSSLAPAPELVPLGIVRLDTPTLSRGRVIRSPVTGNAIGTWFVGDGDSVRLVLAALDSRTLTLPTSSRVPCPQSP